MRFGEFELHGLSDGFFGLDGGAMFGVVPRPLWERTNPPDERNRIRLALRPLLVVAGDDRVLIDTGIGDKWDTKNTDIYRIEHTDTIESSLARVGFKPEDITKVVLTHLHFDHADATAQERGLSSRTPTEEPDLGTLRVQRRAGYWMLRKVFEYFLHSELHAAGISPSSWVRRRMAQYGRKVFNALFRTRGPKEPKRAERMARLREWALKQHLPAPIAEYMEFTVGLTFEDMRAHDELDWLPPPAESHAIMALKPKQRVVTDAQMCLDEWWDAHNRYFRAALETYERAHKTATDVVASARCDAATAVRYRQAAMRAANIASYTAPGTPWRRQSVADFQASDWPPELDRNLLARALSAALEVWDASRATLPPAPGPKPH
ncbi:MAG: MBL fold metallo-hydrolase [candidate division WOR-3 bacterium]|nr:MBL fold metallo-hydrolase [candidate division WOR-3 bacterium]